MKKNLVDQMGLELTKQWKTDLGPNQMVGKNVLKDLEQACKVAEKRDFSLYTVNEYDKCLIDSINDGIKKCSGDFYLEITYTRNSFYKRKGFNIIPRLLNAMPIPFYGKDLYFYSKKDKKYDVVWAIPEKQMCDYPELVPLETEGRAALMTEIQKFNSGLYTQMYQQTRLKEEEK